ncbi:MAG: hypothetical protein FWG63_00455 [Defluviitaleaceae bacterium]|nr:hypothetical protein [Defluviitaleaceae bacterium]
MFYVIIEQTYLKPVEARITLPPEGRKGVTIDSIHRIENTFVITSKEF